MEREIKFRAWDGERMIAWHQVQLFRWIQFAALKNIMQYTGLKDKNGKEIYEGDIVRILYSDWLSKSDSDPRTIDQYLTDIAKVKVVIWSFNGFYVSHEIDGYAESMDYGKYGYIEVIGNIYEHPELLKEEVK